MAKLVRLSIFCGALLIGQAVVCGNGASRPCGGHKQKQRTGLEANGVLQQDVESQRRAEAYRIRCEQEQKERMHKEHQRAEQWELLHDEYHRRQDALAAAVGKDQADCDVEIAAVADGAQQMRVLVPAYRENHYCWGSGIGEATASSLVHYVHSDFSSCKKECMQEDNHAAFVFRRALSAVIARGNASVMRALIGQPGVGVEASLIPEECRPLEAAVCYGQTAIAQELLEMGANPNGGRFVSVLYAAIATRQEELVRRLLEDDRVRLGMVPLQPLFLPSGEERPQNRPFTLTSYHHAPAAFSRPNDETVTLRTLRNCPPGDTELHAAVRMRYRELCDALVRKGASVQAKNDSGETPLDLMCFFSSIETPEPVFGVPIDGTWPGR